MPNSPAGSLEVQVQRTHEPSMTTSACSATGERLSPEKGRHCWPAEIRHVYLGVWPSTPNPGRRCRPAENLAVELCDHRIRGTVSTDQPAEVREGNGCKCNTRDSRQIWPAAEGKGFGKGRARREVRWPASDCFSILHAPCPMSESTHSVSLHWSQHHWQEFLYFRDTSERCGGWDRTGQVAR